MLLFSTTTKEKQLEMLFCRPCNEFVPSRKIFVCNFVLCNKLLFSNKKAKE